MSGNVNDPEVTSISVNSVDVNVVGGVWTLVQGLDVGENILEIIAEDIAENIGSITLTITRSG